VAKTAGKGFTGQRRLGLALALLILTAALAGRWLAERSHPPKSALQGNGEDAMAALEPALARMPESARLPFLLESVRDPHPGLRYAAVDELSRYRTPESAAAIESAFRDSASTVRQRAVETLHVVDRERGLLLLLSALQDQDTWIRQTAATQLALHIQAAEDTGHSPAISKVVAARPGNANSHGPMLADRRSVPALIRALGDEDGVVVRYAVAMLHEITGRGMVYRTVGGPSTKSRAVQDWLAWWKTHAAEYRAVAPFDAVRPILPTRSDPAPEIDRNDIDGHPIKLSDLKGQVTLLNFWGTWCPPCRAELPAIERLHSMYKSRGLTAIGAAVSESGGASELRAWCAKNNLTYRQMLSSARLQEDYGDIDEVPVTVLIDKQGRIRYRWEGDRDYPTFRAAIERLLAE
jgi:peroxiredoxin